MTGNLDPTDDGSSGAGSEGSETLYSARGLARLAEIAETTVLSWSKRPERPLRMRTQPSGAKRFTLKDLREFINANQDLNSANRVRAALARLDDDSSSGVEVPLRPSTSTSPSPTAAASKDAWSSGADVASVARDIRAGLDSALDAVVEQSRLAQETARSHAKVIEDLRMSLRALDGALTTLSWPVEAD